MKATVITGSPHKKGTSALLADEFIRGAREAGWDTYRFDAAFEQVAPCLGCDHCGIGAAPCVQKDGMQMLMPELLTSQAVVLVTPLYYFGFSAQIKRVIDRFYSCNYKLTGNKRVFLLATAYDRNDWTMKALTVHYETLTRYLQWKDAGRVLAVGCGVRSDIERSQFPQEAYRLGLSLK